MDNYIEIAIETGEQIKRTIDAKAAALEQHDYGEAYRLAGLITLLASNSEELDGQMWELRNPEEVEDEERGK